jgi:hypothetical protein
MIAKDIIRKVENQWKVFNKEGNKLLGTHPTKEEALAQLRAIEAHKNGDRR